MKRAVLVLLAALSLSPLRAFTQASEIPSAAPVHPSGETSEQRGRALLDQMVEALGGDAWLHRKNMTVRGRNAAFFHGAPNGAIVEYSGTRQFPVEGLPEAERLGYITDKSMFFPGKKTDIVQVWTGGQGFEITYKGKQPLPIAQVEDYYRRNRHSIESVIRDWLHEPGVVVVDEGNSMVERRLAQKVTVLSANNDAVTIELDATSHLPLRRTFEWRNEQFKDHDEDVEEYDDYHTIQGLPTAMTLTRYHDGDMASQRFYSKVEYNTTLPPDFFTIQALVQKK